MKSERSCRSYDRPPQRGEYLAPLRRSTLAALAALAIPAVAAAQDPPRVQATVFVTATVGESSLERVGQTTVVLSREALERLGITWIADALRLAPGVDVRARGPFDVQSDFSIRGATFGQNLVLLDGRRLNDSQSGHHNGDLPVAVINVDRIEVVTGPGSAAHGADALGGTINVITRSDRHLTGIFSVGEHGYVSGQASLTGMGLPRWLGASIWGARSSGFMIGREFALGGASVSARPAPGVSLEIRHVNKAFGANGFYGPSMSKEWTDHTVASLDARGASGPWTRQVQVLARNHGDHFRWDVNRPGFAENLHRTNAVEASGRLSRDLGSGSRLTFGGGGGGDWIQSSNLGDRAYGHGRAFAELQHRVGARAFLTGGLRVDAYSTFGSSVNPSVSAAVAVTDSMRIRASLARGFRIPTFTERFYSDPSNLGSPDLVAEHGWALDAGVDWTVNRWTLAVSPFIRWDSNVIDWVRETPADRWRSTNVRDVTTSGVELSVAGSFRAVMVRAYVSALRVEAPALTLLSKYVLEYARYSAGATTAFPLPGGFRLALNADYRDRADGQRYTLVGARLSRPIQRVELFVEGTNLLNETYREIAGVPMPGRWMRVGVSVR
jgi:iron complex outermembrane receptor protein